VYAAVKRVALTRILKGGRKTAPAKKDKSGKASTYNQNYPGLGVKNFKGKKAVWKKKEAL